MRRLALPSAVLALVLGGCGLGPGKGSTDVRLEVTRDFGARVLRSVQRPAPRSDTVMRLLQRSTRVTTRYGGGFVQSIDGLAGGRTGGRPEDWFYYVNGLEAPRGAAQIPIHAGDRILWDHHDWGATMDTPAIVGQFPEPFLHGSGGKRAPVRLECATGSDLACAEVQRNLSTAGALAGRALLGTGAGKDTLRVLVGPWATLRKSLVARQLERGPRASGVYVKPLPDGSGLLVLDATGQVVRQLGAGAGLVAATRFEDQQPTWLVTGTDATGVRAAARALTESKLANKFAATVEGDKVQAAP